MPRLTEIAHAAVRTALTQGEIAIDATAGNGWDTLFLRECVGPQGQVFAFDIQPEALAATATRICHAANVTLLACDHARLRETIPAAFHGRIGAVMFNLGYLPGSDHTITTHPQSTLPAISAALELLRGGGVLTVLAYTGHPGGAEEAVAVEQLFRKASNSFSIEVIEGETGSKSAPRLWIVRKAATFTTAAEAGRVGRS